MAKNKEYIYKNRKYAFQFPEEVSTEDQAKYLKEVQKAFEKDDIVTIDSKIKVFPQDYQEEKEVEVKEEAKPAENVEVKKQDPVEDKKDEPTPEPKKAEEPKAEPEAKKDDAAAPVEPKAEDVTVTKVETTTAEPEPSNVLIGDE